MENEVTIKLAKSIDELGKIELMDSELSIAIFNKMMEEDIEKRMDILKNDLNANMLFYHIKSEKSKEQIENILREYRIELDKIAEEFKSRFENIQLELQEIECNQKIALVNFNKSIEEKEKILNSYKSVAHSSNIQNLINKQDARGMACIEKFNNYNKLMDECLIESNICKKDFIEAMDEILPISEENGLIKNPSKMQSFINKIRYIFTGKLKFQNNVIEKRKEELSNIEITYKNLIKDIDNKSINFTATIAMMRDNINQEFVASIS